MAVPTVTLRSSLALRGAVRTITRSATTLNASQPAPPSSSAHNPHAARVAATASTSASSNSGGDARSRLAKLQAQRLEELNRGRTSGGAAGQPNKPEQKWSNRTLIALATCVGACTYLMGTYHGYNAGKAHAEEQLQLPTGAPVAGQDVVGTVMPTPDTNNATTLPKVQTSTLSTALMQLLPSMLLSGSIHCEPEAKPKKCRLAELTQYHCDLHTNRVVCQPIDRIFRM